MPRMDRRSERTAQVPERFATRSAPRATPVGGRSASLQGGLPILILMLIGSVSIGSADPYPRGARAGIRRSELATHAVPSVSNVPGAVRAGRAPVSTQRERPKVDADVARRVFSTRLRPMGGSVVERSATWIDVPQPEPRKPLLPKIYPTVMGFPTGGGGVKLKFRY